MYERFTDRARKVMQLANNEALDTGREYVGTEHVLIALAAEGSGVAAYVLGNFGCDACKLRAVVQDMIQSPAIPSAIGLEKLIHTPRVGQAIGYAAEEANKLQHRYIGTEHLLLGLIRQQEGYAFQIFQSIGVGVDALRNEVMVLLGEPDDVPVLRPDPFAPATPAALLADVMAERNAYRERVAKLEAALKPFALLADNNPQADDGVPIRFWSNNCEGGPWLPPTMADCRRASELLYEPIAPASQVEVLTDLNPPVVILPDTASQKK